MGVIVEFLRHAQIRSDDGLKNASIGIAPPEMSLSRLASPREASLRPAKMLRRCASEHSAASARSLTDNLLAIAQTDIGCSDMMSDISTRNEKSQQKIFPPEIQLPTDDFLQCGMAKPRKPQPREIFLGDWLELFDIGPSEAAEIAGCTQSYISNISRGARSNINVLYLLKLSEHLNINIDDFFRPLPSQSQIAAMQQLSPRAQSAIIGRRRRSG